MFDGGDIKSSNKLKSKTGTNKNIADQVFDGVKFASKNSGLYNFSLFCAVSIFAYVYFYK